MCYFDSGTYARNSKEVLLVSYIPRAASVAVGSAARICDADHLAAFMSLVTHQDAYGNVFDWTADDVEAVGNVIGALMID